MALCEVCEREADKICGYEDQPMANFCLEHYIHHIRFAHPKSHAAQTEWRELKMAQDGITEDEQMDGNEASQ